MTRKFQPLKPRNSVCTPRCGFFQKMCLSWKKKYFISWYRALLKTWSKMFEGRKVQSAHCCESTQQRAVRTRMRTHFVNKKRHFLHICESHSLFTSNSDVGGCVKVGTWAFFINTSTATTADEIMFHPGGIFVCWSWTLGADRLLGITTIGFFAPPLTREEAIGSCLI